MTLKNVSLVGAEKIERHHNILVLLEEVTYRLDGGITINQEITMSVNRNACVTNVVRVTMTPVAVSIVNN